MSDALNARSEILARIRSALGRDASAPSADDAWSAIPRNYRQTSALDSVNCIELFVDRLHDYGADVSHCQPAQLPATIAEILRRRNKKKMLVSPDIDPAWLSHSNDCIFVTDDALSYAAIDGCDGVLTGCVVGIAATGTLGLCHQSSGAGSIDGKHLQCRRALTLIPDYHLCIVRASDVVETVPEAMRVLESHKKQPITLISGPSATADIEMTRIQGVHGPRVLDIVIVA
jgi:L-lactate dehydrogenase complex protein LldG